MNKKDKIKNILTFLCIIFGESFEFLNWLHDNISPEYLIEKYERYIESEIPEYEWGMHPNLKTYIFDEYCAKWNLI